MAQGSCWINHPSTPIQFLLEILFTILLTVKTILIYTRDGDSLIKYNDYILGSLTTKV